jgi:uncharacterized protein YcaQ
MKLRFIRSNESDGIADIRREYIKHPLLQHRVKTSANSTVGSAALAWHRGHQAGVFDSYRTLKQKYPTAAKALLLSYGMDSKGSISL